jgi:hypothetical protein
MGACRPRIVECLLTLRRIYEVENNDNLKSPRRPFLLSPRQGTPDLSRHKPLRLAKRDSLAATPDINYQAVQQVGHPLVHSHSATWHKVHCAGNCLRAA